MASKQNKRQYCYTVTISEQRECHAYVFAHSPEEAREIAADRYERGRLDCTESNGIISEVFVVRTDGSTADKMERAMRAQSELGDMIGKKSCKMPFLIINTINDILYDLYMGKECQTISIEVKEWFEKHGFSVTPDGIGWAIGLD